MLIIELNILAFGLLYSFLTKPNELLSPLKRYAVNNNVKAIYCAYCFVGWVTIFSFLITTPPLKYLLPCLIINMLIVKYIDDRL